MADNFELDVQFDYDERIAPNFASQAVDYDPHENSEEEYEGIVIGAAASGKRWEMRVLKIANWPEFKTKTCYEKVRIPLDGWTKVPYPCAWRRTCEKSWYLTVTYDGTNDLPTKIEEILRECAKIALIPAIPLLLAGQPAAAAAAFLEAFKQCLIAKGIKELTGWKVGFDARKTCSKWKRI